MTDTVRDAVRHGPMSRFQLVAVAICIGLNMLDGFDVLVMAFTSSSVAAEWALSGRQVGMLLSAGLFGMTAGSLFLAPWADRFGRRAIVLVCLTLCIVGMLLSAFAGGPVELAALRVVTGIGIGGMLASINVITAEYSSDRWRNTAVSLQATGYPIGATIGGSIAAVLITHYGWRSVFVFGALASAAMVPIVLGRLPESLDFLLDKRPPRALEKVNALLRRMIRPEVRELPAPAPSPVRAALPMRRLFGEGMTRPSVLIALSFFLQMLSFYFVLSWTPKLLVHAGLSKQQGITGGVLLNLGGIVGGTIFGYLAARFGVQRLTAIAMVTASVCAVVFGMVARDLSMAFPVALLIGAFIFAAMVGLYSLTPSLYPPSIRTTGVGWAIGIGRLGAILAPSTAGFLVEGGWQNSALYALYALPLLAAAAMVMAIRTSTGFKGESAASREQGAGVVGGSFQHR
ncbi:MFS transporter [Pendulispora rubella]|uniref:MFS transporter n=1 Tax=Pendulispora rubella TaxID=2741070 RepID=A0ABZ2KXI8_9BACT